ncbi:hypothetical protein TrVE_jg65 [Triparma verrucosa]|uniref:4-hydroxy-4-methyl-2-oxoglutarate aldolase n=1 Tax=Triparma verrucosa TaxID=1606542 RepID=A0A9W7BST7_9STRA|nr:hypothetical protein TrVE_jg65 [Triparma verrucosa]
MKTVADLCDTAITSPSRLQIVTPNLLKSYGSKPSFHGPIKTLRCLESNPSVRSLLSSPGLGRVLIVDGSGSLRCALLGDQLANLAVTNNWSGIIIHGCIRDSAIINKMPIGVKAVGTMPVKSKKDYPGEVGVNVAFGGVEFREGWWVYADEDGVIVSETELDMEE